MNKLGFRERLHITKSHIGVRAGELALVTSLLVSGCTGDKDSSSSPTTEAVTKPTEIDAALREQLWVDALEALRAKAVPGQNVEVTESCAAWPNSFGGTALVIRPIIERRTTREGLMEFMAFTISKDGVDKPYFMNGPYRFTDAVTGKRSYLADGTRDEDLMRKLTDSALDAQTQTVTITGTIARVSEPGSFNYYVGDDHLPIAQLVGYEDQITEGMALVRCREGLQIPN